MPKQKTNFKEKTTQQENCHQKKNKKYLLTLEPNVFFLLFRHKKLNILDLKYL